MSCFLFQTFKMHKMLLSINPLEYLALNDVKDITKRGYRVIKTEKVCKLTPINEII